MLLSIAVLVALPPVLAGAEPSAEEHYLRGVALQKERRTLEALEAYSKALEIDPFHGWAHYEIGWSYWVLGKWPQVVRHWELARELNVKVAELPGFLEQAHAQLEGKLDPLVRVPIGTRTETPPGADHLSLELVARFQHYNPQPTDGADHFDRYVFSPKAVRFAPDGGKVYVNALEGYSTLVFDPAALARRGVISHRFGAADGALFAGEAGPAWLDFPEPPPRSDPDRFRGKPVEFATTHGGRYLWVSHYRRDYDRNGVLPSAVAVVDTARDAIVRVIATGPIPKFLAASPDGKWLAVIHWGDNTVGLIDISAPNPDGFRRDGLIVVGSRLPLEIGGKVNRDRYCGFCLRGAVFTADSSHLLVGRMGGGGIAVVNIPGQRHVGTVFGMKPTPRHLVLSPDGENLYVGSNVSGYVSAYRTADLVRAAQNGKKVLPPLRQVHAGIGTRTLALSADGGLLFAAVNNGSKIVALRAPSLEKILEIPADSYPVGLALAPDASQLWVTAQGRKLRGGNSILVYRIER